MTVKGKTAIITGASRGIGEATARHLAAKGANVVLAARNGNSLDQIAREISDQGGSAISVACDVSNWQAVSELVEKTTDKFGRLDVLVNNAGVIDPIARIDESHPDDWGKVVDINLKGVYYGIRAVLPPMLKQASGTIINISSGAATGALEGWSHYCATKAAVLSLTKCTDKEYRDNGIRVIGLSPGTVATEMQVVIKSSGINPVSRLDPSVHIPSEWVAKGIAFLCGVGGDAYLGTDFTLKTNKSRQLLGLPNIS